MIEKIILGTVAIILLLAVVGLYSYAVHKSLEQANRMDENKPKTRIEKVMEVIEYHKWYRIRRINESTAGR